MQFSSEDLQGGSYSTPEAEVLDAINMLGSRAQERLLRVIFAQAAPPALPSIEEQVKALPRERQRAIALQIIKGL